MIGSRSSSCDCDLSFCEFIRKKRLGLFICVMSATVGKQITFDEVYSDHVCIPRGRLGYLRKTKVGTKKTNDNRTYFVTKSNTVYVQSKRNKKMFYRNNSLIRHQRRSTAPRKPKIGKHSLATRRG